LAKFAFTYLRRTLTLPSPRDQHGRPSIEELNNVLLDHLVARGGQHKRVWGTLELESDLRMGVQRIRCFPFKSQKKKDQKYGQNFSQYMAAISPEKYSDIRFGQFDLANVEHISKLWYGRVELFCRCTFKDARDRMMFDIDLALFSFMYDLKCPAAMTILQREAGAQMFYVPNKPWLCALPINHILGRKPLMKVYLKGSNSPTIPSSMAQQKVSATQPLTLNPQPLTLHPLPSTLNP
jgi:hypothetical protein